MAVYDVGSLMVSVVVPVVVSAALLSGVTSTPCSLINQGTGSVAISQPAETRVIEDL